MGNVSASPRWRMRVNAASTDVRQCGRDACLDHEAYSLMSLRTERDVYGGRAGGLECGVTLLAEHGPWPEKQRTAPSSLAHQTRTGGEPDHRSDRLSSHLEVMTRMSVGLGRAPVAQRRPLVGRGVEEAAQTGAQPVKGGNLGRLVALGDVAIVFVVAVAMVAQVPSCRLPRGARRRGAWRARSWAHRWRASVASAASASKW